MSEFNERTIIHYLKNISENISSGSGEISPVTFQKLVDDVSEIKNKINSNEFINPTHLGIVSAGNNNFEHEVVLCNVTDENITISVIAKDDTTSTQVVIVPGWNPIIVKSVVDATENTLIYGW